jgi:hypothetical protein
MMSIPASIAISKLRIPELEGPVTRGRVILDHGEIDAKNSPVNALYAFAKGLILVDSLQCYHHLGVGRNDQRPSCLDWP